MIDYSIKIDASAALKALDAIDDPHLIDDIADAVATEVIIPNLAKYPPQSHAKMPFVSDKQRRYFFAALRSGQIQVPYRRTGDLSGGWQRQPISGGLALVSSTPYSDLVLTKGQQAKYHRGNWLTTEDVALQSEDMAALAATAVIVDKIGDAGP